MAVTGWRNNPHLWREVVRAKIGRRRERHWAKKMDHVSRESRET